MTSRILTIGITLVVGITGYALGRAQQQSSNDWTTPMVIHLSKLKEADLPPPKPGMNLRFKMLAVAEGATVQVQQGGIGKHNHANSNELQYIISGSGKMWLGDKQESVGPGDLIIIPKGTAHGMLTSYKAIAVKSPPQAPDDMHKLE